MAGRLAGKIAFLTATAAGIGRATALAYAREGARVIATDIDLAGLESLKQEHPNIEVARLDVLSPSQCDAIGVQWPDINVLVNVAGFVHHGTILECPPEEWSRSFDLNVSSMYRTIRSVLPRMLERESGSIVNISSIASSIKGIPSRCVYGATKAAVIGLTKSVAADFVGKGVRCNAICPGTVDSPSLAGRMAATGDLEAARRAFMARQPMQRLGKPEEVAALAVYLGSEESAFTTGTTNIIDGGWIM
jgi:Dehydrogenases with different specificities (related to short-chain alcohol dehydrogenases)